MEDNKFTKLAIENNYSLYYKGLFTGLFIAFIALVYFTLVGKI